MSGRATPVETGNTTTLAISTTTAPAAVAPTDVGFSFGKKSYHIVYKDTFNRSSEIFYKPNFQQAVLSSDTIMQLLRRSNADSLYLSFWSTSMPSIGTATK